jgi:hypothetical protein
MNVVALMVVRAAASIAADDAAFKKFLAKVLGPPRR